MDTIIYKKSFGLILLSTLIVHFCHAQDTPEKFRSKIVQQIPVDAETLIPYHIHSLDGASIENMIFERLLRTNPKTMEVDVPWLAADLPSESSDHRIIEFTLRRGVNFADGIELTGRDVIFSLKTLKNPFNTKAHSTREYVEDIYSCELINDDPYRIRFTIEKPSILTIPRVFGDLLAILPKHIFDPNGLSDKFSWDDIKKFGRLADSAKNQRIDSTALIQTGVSQAIKEQADYFTQPIISLNSKYILGSGPYKLAAIEANNRTILIKNKYYTNKSNLQYWEAYPDSLIYKVEGDLNAAIQSLKMKEIDVMGYLMTEFYVKIDTAKYNGIKKAALPIGHCSAIDWNNTNPIFNDKRVRWAMSYLINRPAIIEKVIYGLSTPMQSIFPLWRKEVNKDLPLIEYDPSKAKQLLLDAGWGDSDSNGILDKNINGNNTPFSFTFMVNYGNQRRKQYLIMMTESLRKVGIKAEIEEVKWSEYQERLQNGEFDASFSAWGLYLNEDINYIFFHSSQTNGRGSNYARYHSKEADKLLEAIKEEYNSEKRVKLHQQVQKVVYDDQPVTFLWETPYLCAWVDRFDNIEWLKMLPGYLLSNWKPRAPK